jgi:hypothetical protein
MKKNKIVISTVVWGKEYLKIFSNYCLKSLLFSGNVNSKTFNKESIFFIFTERKNLATITKNKYYLILKKIIRIKFKFIKINNNKYETVTKYQKIILDYCQKEKGIFIHIYPDSILNKNYIKNCLKKINYGYKLILCPGPLINLEDYIYNSGKYSIQENLHNFYKRFLYYSYSNNIHIYKFKKDFLFKCFHCHIAAADLNGINTNISNTLDEDLISKYSNPSQIYYSKNREDIGIVSLESALTERGVNYNINIKKQLKINDKEYILALFKNKNQYEIRNFILCNFSTSKNNNSNKSIIIINQLLYSIIIKYLKNINIKIVTSKKKNMVNFFQYYDHKKFEYYLDLSQIRKKREEMHKIDNINIVTQNIFDVLHNKKNSFYIYIAFVVLMFLPIIVQRNFLNLIKKYKLSKFDANALPIYEYLAFFNYNEVSKIVLLKFYLKTILKKLKII